MAVGSDPVNVLCWGLFYFRRHKEALLKSSVLIRDLAAVAAARVGGIVAPDL